MDMHTFKDRIIDTEKLEVMVDDNGNLMNMFEVYKNMAKYYIKENPDKRIPVRIDGSYDKNEKTGEWEVIGYNYAEDYITTLTEREKDKEKIFSEENEKKGKDLENEESNLPIKKGFFDRIREKIYDLKKWIKGKISKDNIEEVELEEEKLEENVIKEEKNYNNYDQKIEEAVEKFESKIKEEQEKGKDEVGKEI